jgi:uncharacterized cupredoxin-like copper-binding protein
MKLSQHSSLKEILITATFAFVAIIFIEKTEVIAASGEAGHGHGKNDEGHQGGMDPIGEPGKASEVNRTITIVMKDNFYEPKIVSVKLGETILFKIVNKGDVLHEFGIGTAPMHKAHQKEMAAMMEHEIIEVDRINHEKMKMDGGGSGHAMKHDDPNSILLEPGKSGKIIWKFTQQKKLEFACNIPGHYESGMMGPIQIQF